MPACEPHCLSIAATSSNLGLRANMTSSIKPQMHAVNFVVNELLCFVKFHYGKVPKGDILTCINGFYTDEEVSQAKKLIFQLLHGAEPKVSDPARCVTRKESNNN